MFDHLVLDSSVLSCLVEEDLLPLLVLYLHKPLLLHLFLLRKVDCFLDLLSFILSFLAHLVDLALVIFLDHLIHAKQIQLLLDLHLILLLESHDLTRSLLSLLDLLPCLHLLLLQQGDSVRQQLSVSLNAIDS